MATRISEGLLIDARPLKLAEMVGRRIVGEVRIVDGALLLEADPGWIGAINTVLVKKGVRAVPGKSAGSALIRTHVPIHRGFITVCSIGPVDKQEPAFERLVDRKEGPDVGESAVGGRQQDHSPAFLG